MKPRARAIAPGFWSRRAFCGDSDGTADVLLQSPQSNRLIRTAALNNPRKVACLSRKRARGCAGAHPTLRPVAVEFASRLEVNPLRHQRRHVALGDERDLRHARVVPSIDTLGAPRLTVRRIGIVRVHAAPPSGGT